ncbi:potassium channel protein, partial [Candidatus Bathyarchaeota archaeon]
MVELEKIEYKPISVRDLLIEMKNLSELMLDLAYSAALFNSHELAEEVLSLERHIDLLAYLLNMNLMMAARDVEGAEALLGVSRVSSSADKISDAAADIATIVLRGIGIHPIVREAFERVEERLARVEVKTGSQLAGKNIGSLELGIDVIALRRGRRWIIDPSEDEVIRVGDVLIARGAQSGIEELSGLKGKHYKVQKRFEGIIEDLVKLKDTSELMLDLAYSSLLLNSRELADEVQALEEYMDNLHTEFELRTLSSGFKPEESKDF